MIAQYHADVSPIKVFIAELVSCRTAISETKSDIDLRDKRDGLQWPVAMSSFEGST